MRDRLIDIIKKTVVPYFAEFIADDLITDGWMRPPCKVGDKVYFVPRNSGKPTGVIDEVEIVMIGKIESGFCAKGKLNGIIFDIMPPFEIDNYSFYRTKEEAEQALTCQESRQVEEGGARE